jgi:hypothetical protein
VFSLQLRQFLIAHFIALLEGENSLEAVEQPTSVPRAYGQLGVDGSFTPRQATLMPRPGQAHTTVMLGGRRVALGDTPRYIPPLPERPRGSPIVTSPMPYQPVASRALAEKLGAAHQLNGAVQDLPTWAAMDFYEGYGRWIMPANSARIMQSLETGDYLYSYAERFDLLQPFPGPERAYHTAYLGQPSLMALEDGVWEIQANRNAWFSLPMPAGVVNQDTVGDSGDVRLIVRELPDVTSYAVAVSLSGLELMVFATPDSSVFPQDTGFSFPDSDRASYSVTSVFAGHARSVTGFGVESQTRSDRWAFYTFSGYGATAATQNNPDAYYAFERPAYYLTEPEPEIPESSDDTAGGNIHTYLSPPIGQYAVFPDMLYSRIPRLFVDGGLIFDFRQAYADDPTTTQDPYLTASSGTTQDVMLEQAQWFVPGTLVCILPPAVLGDDALAFPEWVFVTGGAFVEKTLTRPGQPDETYWVFRATFDRSVSVHLDTQVLACAIRPRWTLTFADDLTESAWQDYAERAQYRFRERYFPAPKAAWIPNVQTEGDLYSVYYQRGAVMYGQLAFKLERYDPDTATWEEIIRYGAGGEPILYGGSTNGAVVEGETAYLPVLGYSPFLTDDRDNRPNATPGGYLADTLTLTDMPDFFAPTPNGELLYFPQGADFLRRYTDDFRSSRSLGVFVNTDARRWGVSPRARDAAGWSPPSYPETLDTPSLEELSRVLPLIHDGYSTGAGSYYGRIANPLLPPQESLWLGITFTASQFVYDAFYGAAEDGVYSLWGVVISESEGSYSVQVSRDFTPLGSWPLMAFFPTSSGTLSFLDGTIWDGILKPHLNALSFEWPFEYSAFLPPFSARLRNSKTDKLGTMFREEAATCPLTLYFESFPDHA